MNIRKIILIFHLVGGLISALFLIALGLTGSALVFEGEIDHWLNGSRVWVQPQGDPRPLSELCAEVERQHPGSRVDAVMPSESAKVAYKMHLRPTGAGKGFMIALDQYTGRELGSLDGANTFMSKVHQFHTNLLLGPRGKLITAAGAMFLFALSISGLVLWWPRKLWKWSALRKRTAGSFELHNVVGFYASIFMVIFAVTGLVIHWDTELKSFINRKSGAPETPSIAKVAPIRGTARMDAGGLLDAAQRAVPGARVTSIQGIGGNGAVRITMKYPEDGTPAGRTNLFLDPVTGEVLSCETSRTAPLGVKIAKLWNREIHTGDLRGLPTRIFACIASSTLPLLAITGPLIWWNRWRRKRSVI